MEGYSCLCGTGVGIVQVDCMELEAELHNHLLDKDRAEGSRAFDVHLRRQEI